MRSTPFCKILESSLTDHTMDDCGSGGMARKLRSSPQFGITLAMYEFIQRILFVDFGGGGPAGSQRETAAGRAALSANPDHCGGYAVAPQIFAGMESKFGLMFPKQYQHNSLL